MVGRWTRRVLRHQSWPHTGDVRLRTWSHRHEGTRIRRPSRTAGGRDLVRLRHTPVAARLAAAIAAADQSAALITRCHHHLNESPATRWSPMVSSRTSTTAARAQTGGLRPPATTACRDLRDLPWSSIDNDESRDLDQLEVCVETGRPRACSIAIADVDVLVPEDRRSIDTPAQHDLRLHAGGGLSDAAAAAVHRPDVAEPGRRPAWHRHRHDDRGRMRESPLRHLPGDGP